MENRTGKYLKYAIGEIILVVIGILIALQINNWNELRKQQDKELVYLQEISDNLLTDIHLIDSILIYNTNKKHIVSKSMSGLLELNSDDDIINALSKNYDLNSEYFVFEQKNAAFKNMIQAESIGLVRDYDLRNILTLYYNKEVNLRDGTQKRLTQLVRSFTDISTELILNKNTITQITGMANNWPSHNTLSQEDKSLLLSLLINILDNTKSQDRLLVETKNDAIKLVNAISKYLENKND